MANASLPNSTRPIKTCSFVGCERPHKSQGYCFMHYRRFRVHGDPSVNLYDGSHRKPCSVANCDRPVKAKGVCTKHYYRLRFNGDPTVTRVDSKDEPLNVRFWRRVDVKGPDDCWLWTRGTAAGYGMIKVDGKDVKAHRVSYLLHNGHWPEPCCLHSCDTPTCVNPAHLREGTHQENMADARNRKRFPLRRGELNHKTKLTEGDVVQIKVRLALQEAPQLLAREFDVAVATIWSIKSGKNWGWLTVESIKDADIAQKSYEYRVSKAKEKWQKEQGK